MTVEDSCLAAVVVRRASEADADALSRFAARVFVETFAATATAEDLAAYVREAYGPAIQAQEIADGRATLFLAEDASAPAQALIGYAHLLDDRETGSIELKRIYIDARWQGRGLARRLLEEVLRACHERGTTRLWLSVWHRNDRAIAFYRKHAFRTSAEMRFDWGDDTEVGFVMEIDPRAGRC